MPLLVMLCSSLVVSVFYLTALLENAKCPSSVAVIISMFDP